MSSLPQVDHLVFACPDLEQGVEQIADLLGVRATPGGRHEGLGTHNAGTFARRSVISERWNRALSKVDASDPPGFEDLRRGIGWWAG